MTEDSPDTINAIAELDHFEGDFAEFAVLDSDGGSVSGVYPYVKADQIPDDAGVTDVFEIEYDPETEEIVQLEHSEEATKEQKVRNAKRLVELKGDDVVADSDDS